MKPYNQKKFSMIDTLQIPTLFWTGFSVSEGDRGEINPLLQILTELITKYL